MRPSWARKAPDGAAVKLSLPCGCGSTSAIRKLETAQPIAVSAESSIETSMSAPSCVTLRRTSALEIANAAVMPASVSATGKPLRKGALSAVPVTLIIPERPWMIWSYAGTPFIGPSWPKPEMAQ